MATLTAGVGCMVFKDIAWRFAIGKRGGALATPVTEIWLLLPSFSAMDKA